MLAEIQAKIERRQYEFSKHAVDQSIIRDISVAEVEEAVLGRSEIIEDYPDDKYDPSCLILGFTTAGRPLHLQCSYPSRKIIKIITLYEPNPNFWLNLRARKPEYGSDSYLSSGEERDLFRQGDQRNALHPNYGISSGTNLHRAV